MALLNRINASPLEENAAQQSINELTKKNEWSLAGWLDRRSKSDENLILALRKLSNSRVNQLKHAVIFFLLLNDVSASFL